MDLAATGGLIENTSNMHRSVAVIQGYPARSVAFAIPQLQHPVHLDR